MMKRYILLFCLLLGAVVNAQPVIGPKLSASLAEGGSAYKHRITLVFKDQLPAYQQMLAFERQFTPVNERAQWLMRNGMALQQQQLRLVEKMQQSVANMHFRVLQSYWLINMLELEADASAIAWLQQQAEIAEIERSDAFEIGFEAPIASTEAPEVANGREAGLTVIGAPALWQMGYTGRARKAMLVDTGVWPDHPAIQGQFLGKRQGLQSTWLGYDEPSPRDKSGNHGTHVIGTVLGLDTANNDTIGVAFGAYFIATDPIVTDISQVKPWTELIRAFQWAINPDDDTSTTNDIPDVINNSWGRANTGQDSLCGHPMVVQAFSAVEAAGIANVFSAGNNGPGVSTGGVPAQLVLDTLNLFAVGALDGNNASLPIAGFSSRGPTTCPTPGGSFAIKPEVSAPGVNVRSADGRTGYGSKSGTSMAAPHVSGAVLLLKEAFPQLSGRQLLNALYQTAVDLGDPGEDNVFGRGVINLPAAFNFLAASHTPAAPASRAYDLAIAGVDSPATHQLGQDCSRQIPQISRQRFRVRVQNVGDSAVTGFKLIYELAGNGRDSVVVNQTLLPRQQMTITTPLLALTTSGAVVANQLRLEVKPLQNLAETDLFNNRWLLEFPTRDGQNLPLIERFDTIRQAGQAALSDWTIRDLTGDDRSWQFYPVQGAISTQFAAGVRMREMPLRQGQLDELISPPLHFPPMNPGSAARPFMQFQLAYGPRNSSFRDSLFVEVSWDCGQTYTRVYANGGDSLRSFQGVNPSAAEHWRTIVIDHPALQPTSGNMAVFLKFVTKNDFGGNLYITNVSYLDQGMSLSSQSLSPSLKLFPNPASESMWFEASAPVNRIILTDVLGRKVLELKPSENEFKGQLPIASLANGSYTVTAYTSQGQVVQRFVKN